MESKQWVDGSAALAERPSRVITIEATERLQTRRLRVAAYARVSSNSEDQENSFAAQNTYYTALLTSTPEWEMVDIYADEGITGTSAEKRNDFQRLMADCRRGLIDRIVVKSISRFARNTMECLEAIRELKTMGVSVFFEEQGIDTAEMSSEMVTAVHASFAQTESVNISKNMKWGCQKRMQMGSFVPSHQPYGYHLKDGRIQIDPIQAEHIQSTFSLYLEGKNTQEIADYLNQQMTMHPELEAIRWTCYRVARTLRNEKYIGDSLWQKSFHTDSLPRKELKNRGQQPQYYAEGTHPAIIEKDVFDRVQTLLAQRNKHRISAQERQISTFQAKLICEHCGSLLRCRTVNGKTYRACRTHDAGQDRCSLKLILETEFEQAFLRLYYNLKHHPILQQMLSDLRTIRERRLLWREDVVELNKQISELTSQNQMLAELKKQGLIDPDIFIAQTNELAQQLRETKLRKERLLSSISDPSITTTQELLAVLEKSPDFLDSFDPELFGELVDQIIVEDNENIRFRLKNGLELPETIERTVR